MRLLTAEDFWRIVGDDAPAEMWVDPLNATMARFQISTGARQAAFLAQAAHESDAFTAMDESLFYSNPERIRAIFRRHFDALDIDDAWGYINQPERLANRVYANRLGNGDEASGDGWTYRGRGIFQITGRDNYRACGGGIGVDLILRPELLIQPLYACLSAGWFFKVNGCNQLADTGDLDAVTRRVNGPAMLGREDRFSYYDKAMPILA